jgi:hypothetical protein
VDNAGIPPAQDDWLTGLDRWAESQPRQMALTLALSSYFYVIRYPRLLLDGMDVEVDVVADIARETADRLPAATVASLSLNQQLQLGALVFDIDASYADAKQVGPREAGITRAAKLGRGTMTKLDGKIRRAVEVLRGLATYSDKLDATYSPPVALLLKRHLPAADRLRTMADELHRARHGSPEGTVEALRKMVGASGTVEDPLCLPRIRAARPMKSTATRQLASFFVTECNLSLNESEIRTSGIGNVMWAWHDIIREHDAERNRSRGSDSSRGRRRRAARGTNDGTLAKVTVRQAPRSGGRFRK